MIAEEIAEIPMLFAYGAKGYATGDYTDFKFQAAGIFIPGISASVFKKGKYTLEFLENSSLQNVFKDAPAYTNVVLDESSGLSGTLLNSANRKMEIISNATKINLKGSDIEGFVKDKHGYSSNANHLQEVENAQSAIKKAMSTLTGIRNKYANKLSESAINALDESLQGGQNALDHIDAVEKTINSSLKQ